MPPPSSAPCPSCSIWYLYFHPSSHVPGPNPFPGFGKQSETKVCLATFLKVGTPPEKAFRVRQWPPPPPRAFQWDLLSQVAPFKCCLPPPLGPPLSSPAASGPAFKSLLPSRKRFCPSLLGLWAVALRHSCLRVRDSRCPLLGSSAYTVLVSLGRCFQPTLSLFFCLLCINFPLTFCLPR